MSDATTSLTAPTDSAAPSRRPTLFLLPGLGLGGDVFGAVSRRLDEHFESVPLSLPGFGGSDTLAGTAVDDMVAFVLRRIREHGASSWLLVGHSMGGKIATLVARRALDGEPGVFGLRGVVLLAGSPPSPEPMDESRRDEMLGWAADGPLGADAAREFIDGNVGAPLEATDDALVTADLLRASPEAWTAWLTRGSREDRASEVGELDVPALIVAGGADGDLGAEAQRLLNGPVYPGARFETLAGAGHLLTLERPAEVADAILRLWREHAGLGPAVPDDVARTIASGRTSSRTRAIFARRILADDPEYRPRVLSAGQLGILRSLARRAVPQDGVELDLAARIDAGLADGASDGWRNAALPPDDVAYRQALDDLADFDGLTEAEQDARIGEIVAESFEAPGGHLTAAQLNLWFEDCRVDLVRLWLSHPATMARIGFDGYANGGDLVRIQGFIRLRAGEREEWEPMQGARR